MWCLFNIDSVGKFCFTTRVNSNSSNDCYRFSIQVEASKSGYETKSVIEEFEFWVTLYSFPTFTINQNVPSSLEFGYTKQTWTATTSPQINPPPDSFTWSLVVNSCTDNNGEDYTNDLINKLSISTSNGTTTLLPGLGSDDESVWILYCYYTINVTVRKTNYLNKTVSQNVLFLITTSPPPNKIYSSF